MITIHDTLVSVRARVELDVTRCAQEYIEWCNTGVLPAGGLLRDLHTALTATGLTSVNFVLRGMLMDAMAKRIAG